MSSHVRRCRHPHILKVETGNTIEGPVKSPGEWTGEDGVEVVSTLRRKKVH